MRADPQTRVLALMRSGKKSNSHSLYKAVQPSPHFAGQVRNEPLRDGLIRFAM